MTTVQIIHGDCRTVLPTLADCSVQCCVTSPPYYGLRDYGTATWVGGNNAACDHARSVWDGPKQTQGAQSGHAAKADRLGRRECIKCGATRTDRQIGLEPTPDEYVAEMVAVFREVRRVLRDDGTLWLNIGDSYNTPNNRRDASAYVSGGKSRLMEQEPNRKASQRYDATLKPKDLLGIPWLLAFALRADGWYLRSDIIWHKPNPMPESVRDRPTSAHEHVFLLSKRAAYFYDAEAVREPISPHNEGVISVSPMGTHRLAEGARRQEKRQYDEIKGANARNVWTIATHPYSGAHFATMPPELAERCIKAGTKPGDTVLDPFGGAGTTGLVADRLNRNAVLIELNPEYRALAMDRVRGDAPLLAVVG